MLVALVLVFAAPLAADAQQPGKVARIGYLSQGSATSSPQVREAFRQQLRELGYVEGQNIELARTLVRQILGRIERLAWHPT